MIKLTTPETDALDCELNNPRVLQDRYSEMREHARKLERERDEAREALDRIAHPVWWMQEDQKRKTGSINGICGGMALALSEDAEYLKGIAKSALKRGTK